MFEQNLSQLLSYFETNPVLAAYLKLAGLLLSALILFYICRAYYIRLIKFLTKKFKGLWAQVLFDDKFLFQLSWILPFIVIHHGIPAIKGLPDFLTFSIERVSLVLVVYFTIRSISVFLSDLNEDYSRLDVARNKPIKGFVQIGQIILWGAGIIILIAAAVNESPVIFLSGLGAMTAVLLLVFRDTLLSLVAGAQLTTNNLIQVGDWVEMPQFGADGDVVDIALHSVKIQNWDKTISVIPTHKFLEHSFKNWRGMSESGGRRIKRALYIDMHSVKFLDEEEIDYFRNFELLKEYIALKKEELTKYNDAYKGTSNPLLNSRRLTNLGTLRAYVAAYLKNHPNIHKDMTFLVRQLAPTHQGIPLEIYVFTNDTRWANYEAIQADIFDHILAILPEFKLNVFQDPTGKDFSSLTAKDETKE